MALQRKLLLKKPPNFDDDYAAHLTNYTRLSECDNFVERNEGGKEWRKAYLVSRPSAAFYPHVAAYKGLKQGLQDMGYCKSALAFEKKFLPIKQMAQHTGIEIEGRVWDAGVGNDNFMYARAEEPNPLHKIHITDKKYIGRTNYSDREINEQFEWFVEAQNCYGGYHPVLNNSRGPVRNMVRALRSEQGNQRAIDSKKHTRGRFKEAPANWEEDEDEYGYEEDIEDDDYRSVYKDSYPGHRALRTNTY